MPMHVDDALLADTRDHFVLTVSASVLSLYMVLGFPDPTTAPDPLSRKKWVAASNHERRYCGIHVNSRTLMLSMLPHKRDQLLEELDRWLVPGATLSLSDFAQLTGTLVDHARICRWARCYIDNIVNQLRWILDRRYHFLKRQQGHDWAASFGPVPNGMSKRLDQLIARAKAKVLWHSRGTYKATDAVTNDLRLLHDYLAVRTNPWAISIGHFIKRQPIGCSFGDALTDSGLGFYSHTHQFYSFMFWSDELRHHIQLKNPTKAVHINQLEMVAYLLQLAAVVTALRHPTQLLPDVVASATTCPTAPQWLVYVDNMTTKFWGEKGMAKSLRGQLLLRIQAALYFGSDVQGHTEYIATGDNVLADMLSRLPDK